MSLFPRVYQKILSPYHYFWVFFSALFLGFPGKKIKVIGITGTKGKSTVVELANIILEEAGYKTAIFSSIKIKIGEKEKKNLFKMTMPGRWHIQKFLRDALKEKCNCAILEVTSEGILQHRHKFINFEAVVFTNLSPEHIERHGSFENYRKAKEKLFKENKKIHILNLDDKNVEYFLKYPAEKKYGFSKKAGFIRKKNMETLQAKEIKENNNRIEFKINDTDFKLNLFGEFNIQNALAAICIGLAKKVSFDTIQNALEKVEEISGRMEVVIEEPFKVIVDYAHTPDSLEAVYKSVQRLKSGNSKMVCVLGAAGGGRDKWKRPKLGKIAGEYCDEIIIANEDPYDENPIDIINEVSNGIKNKNVKKILDRRKAINSALSSAESGDVVIITGKGSEPWMCLKNGKKISWDDRKIAKEEFQKVK